MTPLELTNEWLRLPSVAGGDLRRLYDGGLTREAIHRSGGLAVTRCKVDGALWAPEAAGRPTLVTAVWNGPAPSIFRAVEHALVIDLIAWTPAEPAAMYRRTGVGAILGQEYVDVGLAGDPIRLFANVMDWLRAACAGIVPLDYIIGGYAADLEEAA